MALGALAVSLMSWGNHSVSAVIMTPPVVLVLWGALVSLMGEFAGPRPSPRHQLAMDEAGVLR